MPSAPTRRPRLITIPYSHFCDKARWALERAGIDFVEEPHLPLFSWIAALAGRGHRTVPVLVTEREVLAESSDIVAWADRHGRGEPLMPPDLPEVEVLQADFDRRLGPAARRLAYFHLLGSPECVRQILSVGPPWETRLGAALAPVIVAAIRRGLRIDAEGARRSAEVADAVVAEVEERLADGRPYLCGDRFTAADLAFAALSAPLVFPDGFPAAGLREEQLPPTLVECARRYRGTVAGAFARRIYETERRKVFDRAVAAGAAAGHTVGAATAG